MDGWWLVGEVCVMGNRSVRLVAVGWHGWLVSAPHGQQLQGGCWCAPLARMGGR